MAGCPCPDCMGGKPPRHWPPADILDAYVMKLHRRYGDWLKKQQQHQQQQQQQQPISTSNGFLRQQLRMNVTTIGPLIASYLAARPSELKQCNPCPGPRTERWRLKSTLFPIETAFRCICNGRGYCIYSLDMRPSLTLRCTCIHDCHTHPAAEWKAQAWKVVYVLMLGKPTYAARPCPATRA